jgi:hypothetical protein
MFGTEQGTAPQSKKVCTFRLAVTLNQQIVFGVLLVRYVRSKVKIKNDDTQSLKILPCCVHVCSNHTPPHPSLSHQSSSLPELERRFLYPVKKQLCHPVFAYAVPAPRFPSVFFFL